MPRGSEAREWWAEVDDVRERIERRRAREGGPTRRGVRVVRPESRPTPVRLMSVDARLSASAARDASAGTRLARRRPRPRPAQLVGPRPDRIASWAVALGFLLVLAAILSAH
ncbi:MAG TPA: hypothetical protein VGL57_06855 [Solirubrobacteraceae bacterium]